MQKILRRSLIALGVLCIGLIVFGLVVSLQPSAFMIQRFAAITAPPEKVFPHVNDLRAWEAWTPWEDLDPNPKTSFSTPSAGKGASFAWNGNDEIGEGSLTILDSRPDELVELEQAFVRPLAGKARMAFTFVPEGSGTRVTWRMDGTNDFLGKAVCMFMDMDAMVGTKFDLGLAKLKSVVEQGGASPGTASR